MPTTKQWIVEAHHAIAGPVPTIKVISKGRAHEQGSLSPSNQFDHQAFMCSLQRLEEIAKHLTAFVYTCPVFKKPEKKKGVATHCSQNLMDGADNLFQKRVL
jgi:hypothetical protein